MLVFGLCFVVNKFTRCIVIDHASLTVVMSYLNIAQLSLSKVFYLAYFASFLACRTLVFVIDASRTSRAISGVRYRVRSPNETKLIKISQRTFIIFLHFFAII